MQKWHTKYYICHKWQYTNHINDNDHYCDSIRHRCNSKFTIGTLCLGRAVRIRHPLDSVAALRDVHDGHAGNLANAPLKVLVAGGYDVALVLGDALHETVVGVRASVQTRQSLKARVLGDAQCDAVLGAQLLELGHHAVGQVRHALRVQAVHHRLDNVELVFDAEVPM